VTLSATGKGLPGVTINLRYPNGSFAIGQLTDANGRYSYTVTQTGYYQITPALTGTTLYWINSPAVVVLVNASVTESFTANPKTTVFLVHGIGNDHTTLQPLATLLSLTNGSGLDPTRFLVDAGFDYSRCAEGGTSCNFNVSPTSPNYCSIANGGMSLAQYIQSWNPPGFPSQVGPPGPIVLIGYSMGGLMSRDMISKNELPASVAVSGLITLGTPSLGYPFTGNDQLVSCPQLVLDMAGSWFTGTNNPVPPSYFVTPPAPASTFLPTLAQNWASASYGHYWMAAAGQACQSPYRFGNSSIGCPVSGTTSDCIVCANSAAYQGTVSGQAPGPAPSTASTPGFTPWVDNSGPNGSGMYVHTFVFGGLVTASVLGTGPVGSFLIYNPPVNSGLLNAIMGLINAY
jgi:pimeloyl-ACP methyl ester carboxylesterase